MNDNLDWGDLINEALDRARGDSSEPVAGAKLRVTLSRMLEAREPGVNLGDFLRSEQLTFAGLVERWTDLKVIRRQGTDMLVARSLEEIPPEALQEPQPRALPSIRQDLYSALTLMGTRTRYFYDKSTDEVVALSEGQSQETANLVALPAASLEEEVRTRESSL